MSWWKRIRQLLCHEVRATPAPAPAPPEPASEAPAPVQRDEVIALRYVCRTCGLKVRRLKAKRNNFRCLNCQAELVAVKPEIVKPGQYVNSSLPDLTNDQVWARWLNNQGK